MEENGNYHYFFKTLSNELRMDVLLVLKRGEKCVSEVADEMDADRSKVSHALKHLLRCNFVTVEPEGRKRIYSLNENTIEPLLELAQTHVSENCDECELKS